MTEEEAKRLKREPWRTPLTINAFGGTELQQTWLYQNLGEDYLSDFQIIPSRPAPIQEDKWRILWCHDLAGDPASKHLENGGWEKYHRIVFVSHFQREQYLQRYSIPHSRTAVLHNAITPIEIKRPIDPKERLNFVYHTTPHRGLEILVPVFEKLHEKYGEKIHLDVFSSFGVYGWAERDKPYLELFTRIGGHSGMTYHGALPNEAIREHLATKAHVFAYPSIWPETSCIALMEAMSAGLICLHPNFAALPETSANWTFQYNWHEDVRAHASIFHNMMDSIIQAVHEDSEITPRLNSQKDYADLFYSWGLRSVQWKALLEAVKSEPKEIKKAPDFVYRS